MLAIEYATYFHLPRAWSGLPISLLCNIMGPSLSIYDAASRLSGIGPEFSAHGALDLPILSHLVFLPRSSGCHELRLVFSHLAGSCGTSYSCGGRQKIKRSQTPIMLRTFLFIFFSSTLTLLLGITLDAKIVRGFFLLTGLNRD